MEGKSKNTNDNVIHVRLGTKTAKDVERFATEVYGFRNTSEFMRHVLDYIETNKPVLGKAFAPGS